MPLEASNRPVEMTITIQDRDNNKRTTSVIFPGTVTIADILANLAAVEAAVAGITNGYIVDGTVTINLLQTTDAAEPPPESSDVERKAAFVFLTDAGTYAKYEIPSVDPALVVDGTNVLDRNNAAVAAYVTLMTGGVPAVGNPVTGAGIPLDELFSVKKIHRGSSKG